MQTGSSKGNNQQIRIKFVKRSIINLTDIASTEHQTSLLKLAPNFVPTQRWILFTKIITATESVTLNLEYRDKRADG